MGGCFLANPSFSRLKKKINLTRPLSMTIVVKGCLFRVFCCIFQERYHLFSRDPERAPMQWSDDVSAGFSSSQKTWLPVNAEYKTQNVQVIKHGCQ